MLFNDLNPIFSRDKIIMNGTRGKSLCGNIAHYLNREIGDEELLLDNLDLDWNAKFQAQYKVKAGKWVNSLYKYPNNPAARNFITYINHPDWPNNGLNPYDYNLTDNGIFSKEDPFRILPNTTGVLIAEDSIIDLGIDEQGTMSPEYSVQWVCSESYSDSTVYEKRGTKPLIEQDKAVFQARAFPNPVRVGGRLSVKGILEGNYKVQLHELSGKLLLADEVMIEKSEYVQLNLPSSIHSGVYLLRLVSLSNLITFKISVL